MNKYAIFILSHGRANDIKTVEMLQKYHYTGDWYVVIDDEDDQEQLYREKFGEHIIQFNKKAVADETDTGDMSEDRRVGVFARNFIVDEADRLGYKYHLQLDDDFTGFYYRYVDSNNQLKAKIVNNLDKMFEVVLRLLETTPITWLSFALSSDYIGGAENKRYQEGLFRKTMGSFFMKAEDKSKFVMRMNDDITTCVLNGIRGKLCYSIAFLQVGTPPTQHMAGGMTDVYKLNGTYRKSFYSVMCAPSCVKVAKMGITNFRIHHNIRWNNCTPKLLSDRWCKHV